MQYPSHRLSKFGQIEYETVQGPFIQCTTFDGIKTTTGGLEGH